MQKCNNTSWKKHIKTLINIGVLFVVVVLQSQNLPPIQYYSPKQYKAENQNWDISQAKNKFIYVANSEGLLEFDGANWTLYPSPNETLLRSVHVDGDKIYTGCYMEFGFWQKSDVGHLKYTSISKKIKDSLLEDEHFWKIKSIDDWVLFQSLDRIYIYNKVADDFKIIGTSKGILKMFKVKNSIYFQDREKGLIKIEYGEPKVISNNDYFKSDIIIDVLFVKNKLHIITQNNGIFRLNGNNLEAWSKPLNKQLSKYSIYSSKQLVNDKLLLGTISNGIIQISKDGKIEQIINQTNGLGNNTVLSIFEDADNSVWLGLDNGINCINMNSPFQIYQDDIGKLGTVYTSILYDKKLYLGTNQGLFYKDNDTQKIVEVLNTKGQVWSLVNIDETLFCAHNNGTFVVNNLIAKKINQTEGTWTVLPIKDYPNLLLQGTYDGLSILEKKDNIWQFRNKIEGFNNSSKFVVFSDKNEIIVNHEYKGVFKITIDKNFRKVISVNKIENLKKGIYSSIVNYNNNIYYATKEGVFVKKQNKDTFEIDTTLSKIIKKQGYASGRLISSNDSNKLWIFTEKGLNYITPGNLSEVPNSNFISLPNYLREGISGYENIYKISSDKFIFGSSTGYLIFDISNINKKEHKIFINEVNSSPLSNIKNLESIEANGMFKPKQNNLEFSYSIPEYEKFLEVEYSTKLEGLYDDWSLWTSKPNVLYKNLPYGDYIFNVRARVGDNQLKEEATYKFTILKPWYLSNLMIVLYFILGCLLLILINYFYKRYYKKQKEQLLQKTKRELELKDLESKQQIMAINNEKLKQEIESKNRELAISTMSLIKKNEFLNTIKTELNEKVSDSNLKPVIKIIDKNINNKDDWKLFEEAFNNADKDFLKNLKSKHPKLTSNDLRLCAYLRLNLSSKEIAPLLNISPRSVEVKRYRLRKKMNLPHEASLTSYIIEL